MDTTRGDTTLAAHKRPRSRKSIAHMPSPDNSITTMDQENMTVDTSAMTAKASMKATKRSRSKSIGPGGLDALKEDSGNRRKSVAAAPKSILKAAIPLSPLKEIPARKTAKTAPSPSRSPTRKSIPINTNGRAATEGGLSLLGAHSVSPTRNQRISPQPSADNGPDPLGDETAQQAQRQKEREDAIKQRDARRKSLANRRVSFAPEATLHTWDMLEEMHDSTTSTATSSSTRRASEMSSAIDEVTSTPADDDVLVAASPATQRDTQPKKRRRRSSAIPPMNFNNPEDAYSSSPVTGSSDIGEEEQDEDEGSGDEVVAQGVFTAEQEDAIISAMGIKINADDEDVPMEMAEDEITAAFQPWSKHSMIPAQESRHLLLPPEQEKINPFSPAFKNAAPKTQDSPARSTVDEEDMSMDMTRAVGGIVSGAAASHIPGKVQNRRQSVRDRRRSSGSSFGEGTMEFTTAIGGIQNQHVEEKDDSQLDTNEELSMDFTAVLGGIHGRDPIQQTAIPIEESVMGDAVTMDMTTAIGGIVQSHTSGAQEEDHDVDMDMDITQALGGILGKNNETVEQEVLPEEAAPAAPAASAANTQTPLKSSAEKSAPASRRKSVIASETGSPSISTRSPRTRSQTTMPNNFLATPAKSPGTPSRRTTAKATRPTTPAKTPPAKSAALQRGSSPKKLFEQELSASKKTGFTPVGAQSLRFDATAENTMVNAYAGGSPAKRRLSGLGFDAAGLGSPRVAAILERRGSIIKQAEVFTPSKVAARVLRFEDPKEMEADFVREHQKEERRESVQFIMEKEAGAEVDEDFDHTATLKEAIGNMTPRKTPQKRNLKGRKSLAVGAAKGLLGKRPLELDESDEDGTPQGLRGREGSPVKRIRLQAPSSKGETMGNLGKQRQSFLETFNNARGTTPNAEALSESISATTPQHTGHFKDAEALPSAQKPIPTMGQQTLSEEDPMKDEDVVEKIHLQDFLNMTSIRFMELNTTKRRHTVMPAADGKELLDEGQTDPAKQFEDAVVAGACTIPKLELFQHSCRELKKYIAEGRGVIREIEAETFEENPPLFREYMSASPATRTMMDNQFKQMKTHSRLLSKGMWYEWRMKLLDGLKEALNGTAEGLDEDDAVLSKQEETVQAVLPRLLEQFTQLEQECLGLEARAAEFDMSKQEELDQARERIVQTEKDTADKRILIDRYKKELQESQDAIKKAQQEKADCIHITKEAQRVQEELRGWSGTEVNALKGKVEALETKHGWKITSASGTNLTMTYHQQLQLFFDAAAFMSNADDLPLAKKQNSPISLTYIGDDEDLRRPVTLTTDRRFFLQFMRAHLQCLVQHMTSTRSLLSFVSSGWDKANAISSEVRALDFEARTDCNIRSDETFEVKASVLLSAAHTKVDIVFEVLAAVDEMDMTVSFSPRASVVYGEKYKEDRMTDFLKGRMGNSIENGTEGHSEWVEAVRELRKRLVAQGRKSEVKV